jgi:glyoxylase-like metal-dependent hydrolase (beta-lactamase superfamily II)
MKGSAALVLALVLWGAAVQALAAGPLDVRWQEGAQDCASSPQPSLQVHRYDERTFLLRQNPCSSFEANFLYLLVGRDTALLIDSGAIADPRAMPLAATVTGLLPGSDGAKLPLVVAHTHSHRDHREGDAQFAGLPGVEVVPPDEAGVRRYYGLDRWPEGEARMDLGGRVVHVLPAPGHNGNHVVFYDEATGLLFSGDFLMPGRITVDDTAAFETSARRIADFARGRAVTHVLGGHVELDERGRLYPMGATYHPHERRLELDKADLLALPEALARFNGFYSRHPDFAITHPVRNLAALGASVLVALALVAWLCVRLLRRRRASRLSQAR